MLYISKTSRCRHLSKILIVIISIYKTNKSYTQINKHLNIAKLTIIFIIYLYNRQLKYLLLSIK